MTLRFIQPLPELRPYISKLWLCEHTGELAQHGTLIVPNARPKIILPYKNGLTTTGNGKTATCSESEICFIGIRDVPVTLGSPEGDSGSIGIELTTAGAYKFLRTSMAELANDLFSFSDLFGKSGKELTGRVGEAEDPLRKAAIIQDFLLNALRTANRSNGIVDYTVDLVLTTSGLAEIALLEKKTGYSRRYLGMLFNDHLGISPKTYSTIVRFQAFYKSLPIAASTPDPLGLYYDQSHFIREFRRYTGLTPTQYAGFHNGFGRQF
jgi:AraC-like DNA-binding protein